MHEIMTNGIVPTTTALPVALEEVNVHPVAVYVAGLSKSTAATMLRTLHSIARMTAGQTADAWSYPWEQLRQAHTAAIRSRLAEKYSPATANLYLSAIRGVLKTCWRLSLMGVEDYHRAIDVPSVRGERLPAGRSVERGELRAMFRACARDPGPAGRRDAAIVAVMCFGPRRAEVATMNVEDYDADTGTLVIRHGKGNKQRNIYLANGARQAMTDWLDVRNVDLWLDENAGPLFVGINKAGRLSERAMGGHGIFVMIDKRRRQAKVKRFSPHDMRRTFIGEMLDAGADISIVQQLVGHACVTTTQRYDRRPESVKQKASELLHVEYVSPDDV